MSGGNENGGLHKEAPKFGDHVRVAGDPANGIPETDAFVFGFLAYGQDRKPNPIAIIGSDKYIGAPYNVAHLTVISSGHDERCWRYRGRYVEQCPGTLVPMTIRESA